MSVMTRSAGRWRCSASPWAPSVAGITSWPSDSSAWLTSARESASSSITRIRAITRRLQEALPRSAAYVAANRLPAAALDEFQRLAKQLQILLVVGGIRVVDLDP